MNFSIRRYSRQPKAHQHDFHQLVLPLQGSIRLQQSGFQGLVSPGQCVVIHQGKTHQFAAAEAARFLVADLHQLPANLQQAEQLAFAITPALQRFCEFIEAQLSAQVNPAIEQQLATTFWLLLSQQQDFRLLDDRLRRVIAIIDRQLHQPLCIAQLAEQAHLSATQLKSLFRRHTGDTLMGYICQQRMNKAKALLLHTDLPVQHIAEYCGYQDGSAFSRRFRQHFGLSPSQMRQ